MSDNNGRGVLCKTRQGVMTLLEWFNCQPDDENWVDLSKSGVVASANGGCTWTVDLTDIAYLKSKRLRPGVTIVKGALIGTVITAGTGATELSITVPGVTFKGNDTFGLAVVTDDGWSTQGLGKVISRSATGLLGFQKADASAFNHTPNAISLIWTLVTESD